MLKVTKTNLHWEDINMAELDLAKLISHFAQSNKAEENLARLSNGTKAPFDIFMRERQNVQKRNHFTSRTCRFCHNPFPTS